MTEVLGFRRAMEAIQDMGGNKFMLEGDAQRIIRMLQGMNRISANLEVVIFDILELARNLCSCSFHYIPRSCNRVAHLVAKHALSLDLLLTWLDNFPIWAQLEALLDISSD